MSQTWKAITGAIETEFPIFSFERGHFEKTSFDNSEEVELRWALHGHLKEQLAEFLTRRFFGARR